MQTKIRFSLLFFFHLLFINQSQSQGVGDAKFVIGLSSQVEHNYKNKYASIFTNSVSIFNQIRFPNRISIRANFLFSKSYYNIINEKSPNVFITFYQNETLIKEKSFSFIASIKYHFWKRKPFHFIGTGFQIQNPIYLEFNSNILVGFNPNGAGAMLSEIKGEFYKDDFKEQKSWIFYLGSEHNLNNKIFFSWEFGTKYLVSYPKENYSHVFVLGDFGKIALNPNSLFFNISFGYFFYL